MRLSNTTKRAYLAMGVCVLLAASIDLMAHFVLSSAPRNLDGAHIFTFACYACLILIWLRLVRQRFLDRRVLACMQATGWVMICWLLVRTVKYELTHGAPGICVRYLWYAFYLGYTFVPATLFLAVLHIGMREGQSIARPWWLVLVGAAALSGLVLTNDLHQLAFRFEGPFDFWETSDNAPYVYHQGPLFFLTLAWLVVLAVSGVAVALVRCRRTTHGAAPMAPLGVLGLSLLYVLAYVSLPVFRRLFPLRTVEFTCIMTVTFMECLVVLGLFPSNEGYRELWGASSLRGALMDARGHVVAAAGGAPRVSPRQVAQAQTRPLALPGNQVLAARPVQGGVAYWVRDLARMRALQEQLEELGDTLAEENAVLAAENALAHEREAVRQRAALYDRIGVQTRGELDELTKRLSCLPASEDAFVEAMNRAAVTAACLKRYANLVLVGESGMVGERELALAFEEVAVWLRTCGAAVVARTAGGGSIATGEALDAFDTFCARIECLPACLDDVRVSCHLDGARFEMDVQTTSSDAPIPPVSLHFASWVDADESKASSLVAGARGGEGV